MRIEFRPQSLVKHLVSENLSSDGKTLNRIIETTGKKSRIIELTYKKSELLPTQWFVESYNVMKRKGNGGVTKSFQVKQKADNKKQIIVQDIYKNLIKETTINIQKTSVKKSKKLKYI